MTLWTSVDHTSLGNKVISLSVGLAQSQYGKRKSSAALM
jgi:hypothetical protein